MRTRIYSSGLLVAVSALLAISTPAAAQVVYSNGAPNGQAGFDIFNDFRAADDIAVTGTLGFDLIRFWGLLPAGSTYAPTIFWQILADAGGVPGTSAVAGGSVLAQRTLRSPLAVGFDSWQFDLAIGPQSLTTGVYWLALHDGPAGSITDSTLLWETTGSHTGSQFAVDFIPDNEWTGNWGADLAFELRQSPPPVTATPEPATLTLLAIGLAGLAAAARLRRRA